MLNRDKFASGGGPFLNIYLPEDSGVVPYCVPSKFTLNLEAYKAAVEYLDLDEVGYLQLDGSGSLTASEAAIALDAWGIDESCEEEFVKACAVHGSKKITATELKDIFVRVGRHKRSLTTAEQLFLLFDYPQCCKLAHQLSMFILGCIFLSTLIMILESMPGYKIQRCAGCEPETQVPMFTQLETFAIVVFTLEYGLKFASSPFVDKLKINQFYNKYPQPNQTTYDLDAHGLRKHSMLEHARSRLGVLGRVYRFIVAPMHMVDLVAIVPWYLERILSGGGALVVLRVVRLARITRLFKAARGSAKMLIFINTLQESAGIIGLLATGVVLIGLVFGTLLAATEQGTWFSPDEQIPGSLDEMDIAAASAEFVNSSWPSGVYLRPDVLGNALEKTPFQSIMHASWCVITTITTVGYGDMYPTTTAGKWVCSGAMFVGLIVLALPITVLGGNFAKQVELHVASMRTQNLTLATAYIDYLKREVNSHHINSPENTRLKVRLHTMLRFARAMISILNRHRSALSWPKLSFPKLRKPTRPTLWYGAALSMAVASILTQLSIVVLHFVRCPLRTFRLSAPHGLAQRGRHDDDGHCARHEDADAAHGGPAD
jgi:hypothetical protein